MFIERQRNTGQSGVEQWSDVWFSVLLHPSQQDFSVFSMIAVEADVDKPVSMKTTAIKTTRAKTFERVICISYYTLLWK